MNWKAMLEHYTSFDDIKNEELIDEAITSCEDLFAIMNKEELMHHNRVLAVSYLALLHAKKELKGNEK